MSPTEFRAAIARLGLSQIRAALFFGYAARQGPRWALGERPVPPAVALALRLLLKHGGMP